MTSGQLPFATPCMGDSVRRERLRRGKRRERPEEFLMDGKLIGLWERKGNMGETECLDTLLYCELEEVMERDEEEMSLFS